MYRSLDWNRAAGPGPSQSPQSRHCQLTRHVGIAEGSTRQLMRPGQASQAPSLTRHLLMGTHPDGAASSTRACVKHREQAESKHREHTPWDMPVDLRRRDGAVQGPGGRDPQAILRQTEQRRKGIQAIHLTEFEAAIEPTRGKLVELEGQDMRDAIQEKVGAAFACKPWRSGPSPCLSCQSC